VKSQFLILQASGKLFNESSNKLSPLKTERTHNTFHS